VVGEEGEGPRLAQERGLGLGVEGRLAILVLFHVFDLTGKSLFINRN
jgi:hypothetical protein